MKLTQNYFNKLLKNFFLFEKQPNIAVGVSGGPDSMALVFLLNQWIKKNNGNLTALIVNHQLRDESNSEAKKIKKYLLKNKINSYLVKVDKKHINKKNMSEARQNRYNKFIKFCNKNKIFHLFLGHHYDDNIETFLFRKIACSNFEGLRSIKEKVVMNNIQILRPLLNIEKKNILEYNKDQNILFIKDPSNENLKYTRVVVRNFLYKNIKYKKQIEKDFDEIKFLYPFYKQLVYNVFNLSLISCLKHKVLIDHKIFSNQNKEIQIKIIEIIYNFLKPERKFLRYSKTMNIIHKLNSDYKYNSNLGGMNIKKYDILLTFTA